MGERLQTRMEELEKTWQAERSALVTWEERARLQFQALEASLQHERQLLLARVPEVQQAALNDRFNSFSERLRADISSSCSEAVAETKALRTSLLASEGEVERTKQALHSLEEDVRIMRLQWDRQPEETSEPTFSSHGSIEGSRFQPSDALSERQTVDESLMLHDEEGPSAFGLMVMLAKIEQGILDLRLAFNQEAGPITKSAVKEAPGPSCECDIVFPTCLSCECPISVPLAREPFCSQWIEAVQHLTGLVQASLFAIGFDIDVISSALDATRPACHAGSDASCPQQDPVNSDMAGSKTTSQDGGLVALSELEEGLQQLCLRLRQLAPAAEEPARRAKLVNVMCSRLRLYDAQGPLLANGNPIPAALHHPDRPSREQRQPVPRAKLPDTANADNTEL